MGIDKIKKKKKKRPGQLVAKSKNGKRPGYYGSDDYGSGEDGQGPSGPSGPSGPDGSDGDYEYVAYNPPAPAPAPTASVFDDDPFQDTNPAGLSDAPSTTSVFDDGPSYSIQDDLTDYATNVGKTANLGGGFEDDDTGESLYITKKPTVPYVSPTQIMKEKEFAFKPDPFTGPYVDEINDPFRNTIKDKGIFSQLGGLLKKGVIKAGEGYLNLQTGGKYGKAKGLYNAAKFINEKFPDKTTAFAKNFQLGTGPKGPPTGFVNDNNNDGNNNIIAKNVVASNIQKYTPAQANNVKSTIDLFEDVISKGKYQGRQLNRSQIAQVANKRSELMQEYDMIMESLV
jgi:hypothetical protein